MELVNILINLPLKKSASTYTYRVPDSLKNDISFGKRVLVEFGKRKVEGFIVGVNLLTEEKSLEKKETKELIKVLDAEPIFDWRLFQLAQWMADTYLCSLPVVVNTIIPPQLNKKTGRTVIPMIHEDDIKDLSEEQRSILNMNLMKKLWEEGELSLKESAKYLSNSELKLLEEQGLINIYGSYSGYRDSKEGYVYILKEFNWHKDMAVLERKAPRQAEAILMFRQSKEIARELLDRLVPAQSIKSLLAKGYIQISRKSQEQNGFKHVLTEEQEKVLASLEKLISQKNITESLLYGVTGSGKTEIYLRAAEKTIENGKKVIILVPEIALTRHLLDIFSLRIKNMAVLHSSMPAGERYDEWKRIRCGDVDLVLGTRSAIFAPLPDLGLIIIDEEQETSYKQEKTPRYHAREVARKRAEIESAHIIMGSATPSVESFFEAQNRPLHILTLKKRVGTARMPSVQIEDMRISGKHKKWRVISRLLEDKIRDNLQKGEQSILFINRRGYSPMTICRECGSIASCPHCSVGMTFHRDINKNVCHYCNYQTEVPTKCYACGSTHIRQIGFGTQRVEEEARALFPSSRIARLDMDSSRRKGVQKRILQQMKNKEIDILIGTQMVAKGLDFPAVSVVGIVDADSMLNLPDFRAGERCFQLIVQAAGRAGRANIPGDVVIQTYNPDNMVIRMAARQDYISFFNEEIKLRQLLNYPPFTNILRVVLASEKEQLIQESFQKLLLELNEIIDAKEDIIEILGPAPCPIRKIRNRYRWQLLIKCENMLLLKSMAGYIVEKETDQGIKMDVEMKPLMTM